MFSKSSVFSLCLPTVWASQVALLVKKLPANAGDTGSIPESGISPGGGCGNPLQYSCLENPMDRGAWWATVQRVSKSWTWLKWLSTCTRQLHANTGELGKPHVKHKRTLVSLGFTQVTWLNGATLNQLLLSVQTLISQDFSISAVSITLTNTGTNLGSLLWPPLHKARCWS